MASTELVLDPETAITLALSQAEILRIQAELIAQLPPLDPSAAFRDMSPLGQGVPA